MIFCLDTSAWMDGWSRDYPKDVFPSLWKNLETQITTGNIKSSEEVYVEIKKKDDELYSWLKNRKIKIFVPIEEEIQELVSEILADHPRLVDTKKNRSQADPFVIATAEYLNAVLVTGEKASNKIEIPKIPDVCQHRGVACCSFLEMLRRTGWQF